jgi:glyoxylate reductase
MHVLYSAPNRLAPELERALGATYTPVDELFERSDVVSLHCPLVPETHHLVDAPRLRRMKPGSVLVNTARGACVDESALADALESGPLAAAGLDVFEGEPAVHPRLLVLENVVLAPHIGSADRPAREGMAGLAADNVIAVLGGGSPKTPV